MAKNTTSTGSVTRYNRLLPGSSDGTFRGADFSSEASLVDQTRLAFCRNMWRDYESDNGGCIETSPGYRHIREIAAGEAHGLWEFRYNGVDYVLCHMGKGLYSFRHDQRDGGLSEYKRISSSLANADSQAFTFNGKFYLLDGSHYWVMNGVSSLSLVSDKNPYVPITYSDEEAYEQRNMLTDQFIERWNIVDVGLEAAETTYGAVLSLSGTTATVTAVNPTRQVLYIPGSYTINGVEYTTVNIAPNACQGNTCLKKVIILGCNEIGTEAFSGCNSLQSVVIHNFATIGASAFASTSSLVNVWLGGNGTISETAFGSAERTEFELFLTRATKMSGVLAGRQHLNASMYIGVAGDTLSLAETYPVYNSVTVLDNEGAYINAPTAPLSDEGNWTVSLMRPRSKVWFYFDGEGMARKFVAVTVIGQNGSLFAEDDTAVLSQTEDTACEADFYILDPCADISAITIQGAVTGGVEKDVKIWLDHASLLADGTVASGIYCEVFMDDGAHYTRIRLSAIDSTRLRNVVLKLYGTAVAGTFSTVAGTANYNDASGGYSGTSAEAIAGCNVCTVFDGRPFLTGNPNLPNTVFYCGRRSDTGVVDPSYIGVCSFMNDGTGNSRNNALLAAGSILMVFKEKSGVEGSIFYHSPRETGLDFLPKDYPATEGASGYDCLGAAYNFLDDYVFVTASGLAAVDKQQLNLERTIGGRSSKIDRLLRGMDLSGARLCEWKGYLVLCCAGELFLADSRRMFENNTGGVEYEWFRLTDIGYWQGQYKKHETMTGGYVEGIPVTRYRLVQDGEATDKWLTVSEVPREVESYTVGTFAADELSTTVQVGYVPETMEAVVESEEYTGGLFRPARHLLNLDGLLYFAYDGGVCCFNTDKRGINFCTYGQSDQSLFVEDGSNMIAVMQKESDEVVQSGEVAAAYVFPQVGRYRYYGDILIERGSDGNIYLLDTPMNPVSRFEMDPFWYTYCGRRYRSELATKFDDCSIPYLAKSTIRDSVVIAAKAMRNSSFELLVRTEREEWKLTERVVADVADFTDLCFDAHSFRSRRELIYKSREREKKWVKKQYCLRTDCYRAPFGIYNLGYGYIIYGKVRT